MGWLSKAVKSVSKTVKSVGKSASKAVESPFKISGRLIKGDLKGATKELGRGVGGAVNFATMGQLQNYEIQKLLRNKTLQKLTLNTTNEIANVNQGFADLQKDGEAKASFYQSGLSLGAKYFGGSALVAAAPSLYASASSGISSLTTGKVLTGLAVSKLVAGGNFAGAAQEMGAPSEVTDLFPRQPQILPSSPYDSLPSQQYSPQTMQSASPSLAIPAALALTAFLVLKRKK